jgi:hypothetical protein
MGERSKAQRAAATVTLITLLLAASSQWACRSAERITFHARVSDLRRPANSYAAGKHSGDVVEISVPGKLLQPPLVVTPVLRNQADWSTPERAIASIISANSAGDATWMIESFAPAERERARRQLSDPMFFKQTRDYYRHLGTVRITGEAEVRGFMVMLLLGQDEDGDATSLITTLAKTPEGWRQTNALAADDEFDLISTAVYTRGLS